MQAGHVTRVRKLYKLILRLHRNLPDDLRVLGDLYAKEEFKRHKKCKPEEASTFLSEWQDYAASMLRQAAPVRAQRPTHEERQVGGAAGNNEAGKPRFGDNLPLDSVNRMTADQLFNLYMLLVNARGDNPHEPIDAGIGLSEADAYANKIDKAKKYITELEKIEKEKIARGEINEADITFESNAWLNLFDIVVAGKDTVQDLESIAVERVEKAKKDAEEVKNKGKNTEIDI